MLAALWIICAFIIIWAMAGYPAFLLLLDKVKKGHNLHKDYSYKPTVTVMAVAHNEEKVIWRKLENLINLDYPKDRYRILVTSDYSTDRTNELVEKFIAEHPDDDVRLYKTVHHRGRSEDQAVHR